MKRIACLTLAMGLMVGCEKAPEVPAAPAVGTPDPAAVMKKSIEDIAKAEAAKVDVAVEEGKAKVEGAVEEGKAAVEGAVEEGKAQVEGAGEEAKEKVEEATETKQP